MRTSRIKRKGKPHPLSKDRKEKAVKALQELSERERNVLDAIAWLILYRCDEGLFTHEIGMGLIAILHDYHGLVQALDYDHEDKVHERGHSTGQRSPGWYTERETGPFKSKALAILASFQERHLP